MTQHTIPPILTCGSYLSTDVTLLLDMVDASHVIDIDPRQKEQLIQSGQQHYSEMLTLEQPPSATHEALYQQALQQGQGRMAQAIASLAASLQRLFVGKVTAKHPLILVSLVRAGLPVGVLLQRALADATTPYPLTSRHYGVSIIRDRGIDPVAMQYLLTQYPHSPLVFVDGWTGKGAIYGELQRSLAVFDQSVHHHQIFHQGDEVMPLVTLADPAGVAWLTASSDDWLIPSGLLNSTVSGLISRTLYQPANKGLHQAVFYEALAPVDHTLEFVHVIDTLRQQIGQPPQLQPTPTPTFVTRALIAALATRFAITNPNRIKPTIAEATRAILRRDPDCVLVNDRDCPADTALLRHLCEARHIPLIEDDSIAPYRAVTLIKKRTS